MSVIVLGILLLLGWTVWQNLMDGMAELEGIRAYRQLRQINHHARRRILA